MPNVNCAVIGCSNGSYKLKKWKNETCDEHFDQSPANITLRKDCLKCEPPFHLHKFPGKVMFKELRGKWITTLKRENFNKKGHQWE